MEVIDAPTTPAEWWQLAEAHIDGLCETIAQTIHDKPQQRRAIYDAETKEIQIKLCAEWEGAPKPESYLDQFLWSIVNKDHDTALTVLNSVWMRAPDNASIHFRKAWGVLCDLCSEEWVFNQDEVIGG